MEDRINGFRISKYYSTSQMYDYHTHSEYELYYAIEKRECHIDSRYCKLLEGDILIIPPNTLHRMHGEAGLRTLCEFSKNFISIYFSSEIISSIDILQEASLIRPGEFLKSYVSQTMDDLLYKYEDGEANPEYFACGLISLLLFLSKNKETHIPIEYDDKKFGEIITYIHSNYSEISGINDIISKTGISKGVLFRLFKKHFDISPITYINSVKIQKACNLLTDKNLNITEVALKCGFNSCTYFDRIFRNIVKKTPADYRRDVYSRSSTRLEFFVN